MTISLCPLRIWHGVCWASFSFHQPHCDIVIDSTLIRRHALHTEEKKQSKHDIIQECEIIGPSLKLYLIDTFYEMMKCHKSGHDMGMEAFDLENSYKFLSLSIWIVNTKVWAT